MSSFFYLSKKKKYWEFKVEYNKEKYNKDKDNNKKILESVFTKKNIIVFKKIKKFKKI